MVDQSWPMDYSLPTSVLKTQEIHEYFHQPNTEEGKLIQDFKMNFSRVK